MVRAGKARSDVPVYDFARRVEMREMPIVVGPYHFVRADFELHQHTYGELVIVLGGGGVHIAESDEYTLTKGDVFYIPPAFAHGFRNAYGMEIQNVAFDAEMVLAGSLHSLRRMPGYHALFHLEPTFRTRDHIRNRLRLSGGQLQSIRPLLDRLVREYEQVLAGHGAMLQAILLELVTTLCRVFSEEPHGPRSSVQRLARVASIIETDFASPLGLDDLATAAHLSRNHLIRLFTQTYGVTPMRRLLHVRLERARDYLATSELPIARIAEFCGFPDANYFTRVFRRHHQMTPREYQQDIRMR